MQPQWSWLLAAARNADAITCVLEQNTPAKGVLLVVSNRFLHVSSNRKTMSSKAGEIREVNLRAHTVAFSVACSTQPIPPLTPITWPLM